MNIEIRLRKEPTPPPAMLVVHFGVGAQSIEQIMTNSILNYSLYGEVLRELGLDGDGSLTLSVYGILRPDELGELIRGFGSRWSRFGTANVAAIKDAGFDLWPTNVLEDGRYQPNSPHHFDIPLKGCDISTAESYPSLQPAERRKVRDRFRGQFEQVLDLFEPRKPTNLLM
ncbi:MAG: hypothetical protein OXH10_09950 [bacterium]|nr:hypothetical protein [bacterium]MCY3652966.1 hypothetical protein [bacterium]